MKNSARQAFLALPDTVIIADAHWFVLDFNRAGPFGSLRKGERITRYMTDCAAPVDDVYRCCGRVFKRKVTQVFEHGSHVGYTVLLVDVTEATAIVDERRRKNAELESLTARQAQANEELEECARQARELASRSEQLRVAQAIHDDAGHAITALHAISQMCLQLREGDPARFRALLDEGVALCENARTRKRHHEPESLAVLFAAIEANSIFPVTTEIRGGTEPPFARALYGLIADICDEAYHNALSHSLAERMSIVAQVGPGSLSLRISDDGAFRGEFVMGFGLTTMAEKVRTSSGTISFHAAQGEGFAIEVAWRERANG